MLKEGDFVKIDFIERVEGKVWDTSLKDVGEKEGIKKEFKPILVVIGAGYRLKGLEEALKGKNVGDHFKVELQPKDAYGERNPKLVSLVPMKYFKKNKITPYPGLVVNVDGLYGIVKSVSGGRVIVDFNHPLAGKKVEFEIWIREKIDSKEEKVKELLKEIYKFDEKDFEIEIKDDKLLLKMKRKTPLEVMQIVVNDLKKWINFKTVEVSYVF